MSLELWRCDMNKFDGIHPYSYETIFGIVEIEKEENNNDLSQDGFSYMYVLRPVTVTCIKFPCIVWQNCIGMRRFQNRTQAFIYLKSLEDEVIPKIKKLLNLT